MPQTRFEALDSLRGLCACIVVLFHLTSTSVIANLSFVRHGWLFVDFFFILSGFVIALSYGPKLQGGYSIREFMALRMGRIYPLHVFVLLLFVAFEFVALAMGGSGVLQREAFQGNRSPGALAGSFAFLHIFDIWPYLVWNQPSWSIAAEMWTYLLFALVARFAGARLVPVMWAVVPVAMIALYAVGDDMLDRTYSFSLVRCIYGFGLGVIALDVHRRIAAREQRLGKGAATLIEVLAVIACVAFVALSSAPLNLLAPLLFFVAILIFARQEGAVSGVLNTAPFQFLGLLSYSIYMTHSFVLARFGDVLRVAQKYVPMKIMEVSANAEGATVKRIAAQGLLGEALAVAALLCVIAFSWVTYKLIEDPFRRWSRDWVKSGAAKRRAAVVDEHGAF